MKVMALQMGYYDHARRRVGDVFAIQSAQEFSARWMRKVPLDTEERFTGSQAALDRELADRAPVRATNRIVREIDDEESQHLANWEPYPQID
jgi:hypothetical protein